MNALSYRAPHQLETEVVEWCDAVHDEAESELVESHETKLVQKLIDYIHGRQWSARARFGRSRPVVNRMFRHFIEQVGMLTDLELDFTVKFFDDKDGFSKMTALCNRMVLDWWMEYDSEMTLAMIVMWGLINTGPAKVQWNPLLNGGVGDIEMQDISPMNFMMVGTSAKPNDAEVCIARRPVTLAWLRRRYGGITESIKPDRTLSNISGRIQRPDKMSKVTWQGLPRSIQRRMGVKTEDTESKIPQVLLQEFWLKDDSKWRGKESIIIGPKDRDGEPMANWCYRVEPGMPLWPRGRVILKVQNKILEDTCNPYWHGRMPFALYRPIRVPWQVAGLSSLEPIAAMQAIINRIYGGTLDTVYGAIERPFMGPKSLMSQGDWDSLDPNEPGVKIPYNNNAPKEGRYLEAPQLAQYVPSTRQDVEREMDMTSGASAVQQALQKKQVPGGDALDMIIGSRSTNIRFFARGLKSFLNEIGALVVPNQMQFYTPKHRIAKYGAAGIVPNDLVPWYGSFVPEGMEPEEFVRTVNFSIRKGTILGIEKSEKTPIMFALRKNHDLSRKNVYRFLDYNFDVDQNHRELLEEAAEAAALAQAGGGPAKRTRKNG